MAQHAVCIRKKLIKRASSDGWWNHHLKWRISSPTSKARINFWICFGLRIYFTSWAAQISCILLVFSSSICPGIRVWLGPASSPRHPHFPTQATACLHRWGAAASRQPIHKLLLERRSKDWKLDWREERERCAAVRESQRERALREERNRGQRFFKKIESSDWERDSAEREYRGSFVYYLFFCNLCFSTSIYFINSVFCICNHFICTI